MERRMGTLLREYRCLAKWLALFEILQYLASFVPEFLHADLSSSYFYSCSSAQRILEADVALYSMPSTSISFLGAG